jgi:hypothetical protein
MGARIQKSGVRSTPRGSGLNIVKKIVPGAFSEAVKDLNRSFIVVILGVPKPPGSVLF